MKMTIKKFQELYEITLKELDELEKSTLLVQCFTGLSIEKVNKMSIKRFNKLCGIVNKQFEVINKNMENDKPRNIVYANGCFYKLNYDLTKKPNNSGTYVELATFSEDIVGNLHKIMASMVTPLKLTWKGLKEKDHERVAEDMLELDFNVAYHACVFFWAVFTKSIIASKDYLLNQSMNQKELLETELMNFKNHLDGFTTVKWLQNLKV
jgi:hypothetical protein